MIDPIELHAWADGEIPRERSAEFQQMLASSPEACAELNAILAFKAGLRDRVSPVECGRQWCACVVRLNELDRVRRVEKLASGRFAWGLSGVFFATILVAGFLHRGSGNVTSADIARMAGTFTHVHRSAGSKALDPVISMLMKEARVSVDEHRMDVVGQAYGNLDGRPASLYDLRDASGPLKLIIVPEVLQLDSTGVIRREHTYLLLRIWGEPCVAWTQGTRTVLLAGDRSFEDLATVASGFH